MRYFSYDYVIYMVGYWFGANSFTDWTEVAAVTLTALFIFAAILLLNAVVAFFVNRHLRKKTALAMADLIRKASRGEK